MSTQSLSILLSAAMLVGLVGCAPQTTDDVESVNVVTPDTDANVSPDVTSDPAAVIDNRDVDDDLNVVVEKDVE